MKYYVDKDLCIGCGSCYETCPDVFTLNADCVAGATDEDVKKEDEDAAWDAMKHCPAKAIGEK